MITALTVSIIDRALYYNNYHNIKPEFLYVEVGLILSIAQNTGVERLAIHGQGTNNLISDFQKDGEAVLIKHELSIRNGKGYFIQKIVRAMEETPITDFNPITIEPSLEDRIVSQVMLHLALTKKRN